MKWISVALGIWILCSGCAHKESVLAQVGKDRLTEEGFFQLAKAVLPGVQADSLSEDQIRQVRQVWVDKELMLLEARSRGLDTTAALRDQVTEGKRSRLLSLYKLRTITRNVQFSEEELGEYAREHGYDRKLQVRHILTRTEQDAKAAWAELQMGQPFEEMVRKWSVDEKTRDKEGRIEGFHRKDQAFPAVAEVAFTKKVGDLFGPIWTPIGYEIGQIVGEQSLSPEEMREVVQSDKGLWNEKFRIQSQAKAEELAERFGLKPVSKGIHLLLERGAAVAKRESNTPLYEYTKGRITVEEFTSGLQKAGWKESLEDSAQVAALAWRFVVPTVLFLKDAHRMGLDREREFLDWVRKREENLLVEALRKIEVMDKTEITEEEVREEYIAHPDRYSQPPEALIQEVLVGTEEEARRMRERIERGEDIAQLARMYSLRKDVRRTGRVLRVLDLPGRNDGDLEASACQARVGDLVGPVRTQQGYSVFRVLHRKDRRLKSFEEARVQATATVRLRKEEERLKGLLEELRGRYSGHVVVHEDVVRALAERLGRT